METTTIRLKPIGVVRTESFEDELKAGTAIFEVLVRRELAPCLEIWAGPDLNRRPPASPEAQHLCQAEILTRLDYRPISTPSEICAGLL